MKNRYKDSDEETLLLGFNNREREAFGAVYYLLYNELYYFTAKLYQNSDIEPCDVIQDLFVNMWESKANQFESLIKIKSFLFVSIKNRFRNYLEHKRSIDKYTETIVAEKDSFISLIAETEVVSYVSEAIDKLPEECAKVFRMYAEGWEIKDISKHLGKSQSTVYAQKQSAISILKRSLDKYIVKIIYIFFS